MWCPKVKCDPISDPADRGEGCQEAEEGAEGGREGGGLERGEVDTGRLWAESPHLPGTAGETGGSRPHPLRFLCLGKIVGGTELVWGNTGSIRGCRLSRGERWEEEEEEREGEGREGGSLGGMGGGGLGSLGGRGGRSPGLGGLGGRGGGLERGGGWSGGAALNGPWGSMTETLIGSSL